MTTKKKVNIGLTIAGAIIAIALAIWAAVSDGTITQDEAEAIGNKVTEGIEQVQDAVSAPDTEEAQP